MRFGSISLTLVYCNTVKNKTQKPIEVARSVKKDLDKYYNHKKKIWRDEEEMYHGKIWKQTNDHRPFENNVFDIIESAVPILSDNAPSPSVVTMDESRKIQAKTLQKAIEFVNKDQNFPLVYPEVIRDSLITGNGYIHTYYDPDANKGKGSNIYEILHYSKVRLSGAKSKIEDCPKARICLDRSRDWLKLKYPDKTEIIEKAKAKEDDSDDSERGGEKVDYGAGYAQRDVPPKYCDEDTLELVLTFIADSTLEKIPEEESIAEVDGEHQEIEEGGSPEANKFENHDFHITSHLQKISEYAIQLEIDPASNYDMFYQAINELAEINPESAEQFQEILLKVKLLFDHIEEHAILKKLNPNGQRLKYPGGYRQIETLDGKLLYDGPNKSWHEEIPLVPFYCYRNGTIYADGMIRHIADSQRMQAVQGYFEYKGLQKVSNPEKEVNLESGLTKDDISNEPGATYEVKEGTNWTVRNLPVGQVSEQGVRFQRERVEKMREISGMTDPTRGEMPDSRVSEVTVTRVQTQALGRIRLLDRQNQLYSLKRLAKLVAHDIIQHWTNEKFLGVEEINGEMTELIFSPLEIQDLDFDIEFGASSMSNVDREGFHLFATSLLNTGKITFKQYTELVQDMPHSGKLKQFAQENDEIQAQAQEMQAQLQQLQMENLKLKFAASPEILSPEEMKMLEELDRQEATSELMGVNEDQPIA